MTIEYLPFIAIGIFIVALLYSSVGHAGASGYIAVMSLFSMAPAEIKPTALVLNILVACIGTWQFRRAGHFRWSLFWPFALLSIPMAYLGGYLNLPTQAFKILLGIVLLFSAVRFFIHQSTDTDPKEPSRPVAVTVGGGLGLLAGLTGTGGGIFLTPLLIFKRWARTKNAAAVSALFILVNSVSGLLGNLSSTKKFPVFAVPLLVAAAIGGVIGSHLGSRRFSHDTIKKLLAVVLAIAGLKLIFT